MFSVNNNSQNWDVSVNFVILFLHQQISIENQPIITQNFRSVPLGAAAFREHK